MNHIKPKKLCSSLNTASTEANFQLGQNNIFSGTAHKLIGILDSFYVNWIPFMSTLKCPTNHCWMIFNKEDFQRPLNEAKIKVTKMIQFWNLFINVVCEDSKNAKIIEILQLGKAVLTLKFNIFTTVGSMLYRLILTLAIFWGQNEVGWNCFEDDINQWSLDKACIWIVMNYENHEL